MIGHVLSRGVGIWTVVMNLNLDPFYSWWPSCVLYLHLKQRPALPPSVLQPVVKQMRSSPSEKLQELTAKQAALARQMMAADPKEIQKQNLIPAAGALRKMYIVYRCFKSLSID